MLNTHNLEADRFILVYCYSPYMASFKAKNSMTEGPGGEKLHIPWWSGRTERSGERGREIKPTRSHS